jgi:glycoside/pentoside/hexuronide:cation symporter, GPH family
MTLARSEAAHVPGANSDPYGPSRKSLGAVRSILYTLGHFGKGLVWGIAELTLLFLLTDVMKFDPLFAGTLIFASILVNILLDPLVGLLTDRLTGPYGSKTFLIALGGPVCAASFMLLYNLPVLDWVNPHTVFASLMLFRAGFSLMDAPHNALIISAAISHSDRSMLSAGRFAFGSLAGFATGTLLALANSSDDSPDASFALIGVMAGALSAAVMLGSAFAAGAVEDRPRRWHFDLPTRLPAVSRKNAMPVVQVALLALILYAGVPIYGKMLVYHARFHDETFPSAATMVTMMVIGQVVGAMLWTILSRGMRLRSLIMAACASVAVMSVAAAALLDQHRYADWLASFGFGICSSGIYIFIWVLTADCVDKARQRTTKPAATLIFSIVIVGLKIGQGLGTFLSGWALNISGYVPGSDSSPDMGITVTTLQTGMPFTAALLAICLLQFYRGAASASD